MEDPVVGNPSAAPLDHPARRLLGQLQMDARRRVDRRRRGRLFHSKKVKVAKMKMKMEVVWGVVLPTVSILSEKVNGQKCQVLKLRSL